MSTTTDSDSTLLTCPEPIGRTVLERAIAPEFKHQPSAQVKERAGAPAPSQKRLPELTTFRALGRQVFGPQAGREYVAEAFVFVWMMAVAAWPLSVVLNQLGTMMIWPPNALW
jgi:hypothetical protein